MVDDPEQPVEYLPRRHGGCEILQDNFLQDVASRYGFKLRAAAAVALQKHKPLDRREIPKWSDFTIAKSYVTPILVRRAPALCDEVVKRRAEIARDGF